MNSNINKKLILKKKLIESRKKSLHKNKEENSEKKSTEIKYITVKYIKNTLVYQNKKETRTFTKYIHVPNQLPNSQSWLWCPIIYDALSLIVGKDIIEVKWFNINFNDYKTNLKETGLIDDYNQIIENIKNYLLKSLTYKNDNDQFVRDFLDLYCFNEDWHHPSADNQELILNQSNTISECEILTFLIINS